MNATGRSFKTIASGLYLEGLAIDFAREIIWYSDVISGGVHGVKADGTKVATLNEKRMWIGGVLMNQDGAVLSTGEGGIMWTHPESGRSGWLLNELDNRPINGINEMVPDGTGGIFFGTADIEKIVKGEAARPTSLYRLTKEGEVIRLADGIGFTNGIMYDQSRRRVYCNDTFHSTWVFDVKADLTLHNRRLFMKKEDVDGMALDADGNIWTTGFRSGFITRLAPDGTALARFETPAAAICQLRFGGPDMRDLFFVSVPGDGGDTLKEGGAITAVNSFLHKGRSPVAGMRIDPAGFDLA